MQENDVLQELECPICFNYLKPPIRMCTVGHSICDSCRKELNVCPICESKFSNGRNMTLERISYKVKYPCQFNERGCQKSSLYEEQEEHEQHCKFRGLNCPQEGCSFNGLFTDLVKHCKAEHRSITPSSSDITFDFISFTICNDNLSNVFIKTHDQYFWLRGKVIENDVYFVVQMLGKRDEAAKYRYKFVVSQGERRTHFEDVCKSIETRDVDLFTNINSSTLNLQVSQFYATNAWTQHLVIEKIEAGFNFKLLNRFGYKTYFIILGLFLLIINLFYTRDMKTSYDKKGKIKILSKKNVNHNHFSMEHLLDLLAMCVNIFCTLIITITVLKSLWSFLKSTFTF